MAMNGIGGSHPFRLQKQALPIGEMRKVGLTATSLFPEEEVRETEESRVRYRKYEEIIRKMHTGRQLTAAEMRFLRQHYPEAAAKADRIQQEIEMVEEQLRTCDTQEKAEQVYEQVRTQALTRFAQKDSSGLAVLAAVQRMQPACKAGQEPEGTEQKEGDGAAFLPWQPEQAFDISMLEKHQRGVDVKA